MTDLAAHAHYADRARRALREARSATLLVEGLGRIEPDTAQILLDDDDGRPRLLCTAGSAVADAAASRCPAILTVAAQICRPASTSVIFAGHLAVTGSQGSGDDAVDVVELQLVSVVLEVDDPRASGVVARQVPLHAYASGGPVPLEAAAETMRLHTNARHADRLRLAAAGRAGLAPGEIIEARLAAVEATGAELEWIDGDGVQGTRLDFPRAAADRRDLASLLRAELAGAGEATR